MTEKLPLNACRKILQSEGVFIMKQRRLKCVCSIQQKVCV